MQELEELPKADTHFKQIVDSKVQSYIDTSSKVADEFMKQKHQAQTKAIISNRYLHDLRSQLSMLKAVKMTQMPVEQISSREIQQMISKYEGIIDDIESKIQAEHDKNKNEQLPTKFIQQQINTDLSLRQKLSESRLSTQQEELISSHDLQSRKHGVPKIQNTKKLKLVQKWALISLEFTAVAFMIVCLIKVLFFS